jgi:hypothetical protein
VTQFLRTTAASIWRGSSYASYFKRFSKFEVDASRATRAVSSNVRGINTLPARLGKPTV